MKATTRRDWMRSLTLASAGLPVVASAPAPRRPNVILIMTDDQGYGDLSLHGNPHLKTPNLDSLAKQGVEFTRFYVSPVCAPTRASLLTGRYNLRCGVHGVTAGMETMRAEETTLAEALRSAGYRTALYGKWHLGEHYPYVPHAQGFDDYIGFRNGHWNEYFDSPLERNGKPFKSSGYITDALTNLSLRFIDSSRDRPFFLYLAYNAPHSPFQLPDEHFRRYKAMNLPERDAAIYGMVASIDDNIGRLLGHLDAAGLARDTIVIFLTDNGPNGQRYNAGLRGAKGSVYEGGVRVPFLLRYPARIAAGRKIDTIAAHIDVYPTLLDLCGVPRPEGRSIDGLSLVPLLAGSPEDWPDRMLFTHREGRDDPTALYPGTVRTQRYNLVNGKELYDIQNDPGEQNNIAAQLPEKVKQLRAAYETWYRSVSTEREIVRLPIPVGYPEENPVRLPAPQSYLHGGLKFFEGSGWAHDWISGWSSTDGWVHWDIDVVHAGRYEIALKYLCPESGLGASVRVSAAGQTVEGVIKEATSMKPRPMRDTIPRTEAPVMSWGLLPLGSVALEVGRSRLSVHALTKPGATVMDLKEVLLKRLD